MKILIPVAALALAANSAFPASAQEVQDGRLPYFRFNRGGGGGMGEAPNAKVNFDPGTGISVIVPCTQCRARVNSAFVFTPSATGAVGQPTWSFTEGVPPAGTSFYGSSGTVSGAPSTPGTGAFKVSVSDSRGRPVSSPQVSVAVVPAPTLAYGSSTGAYGRPFAAMPVTANVYGRAIFRLVAGVLPDGLTLDEGTGQIAGQVRSSVTGIQVAVFDDDGARGDSAPFDIFTDQPDVLYAAANYEGRVSAFMSVTPKVINFGRGFKATLSGALPPGLGMDEATGVISGTPTQAGPFDSIIVSGADSNGLQKDSRSLRFIIAQPSVTYSDGTTWVGQDYTLAPRSTSLNAPRFYLADGTLPLGLNLAEATGVISGRLQENATAAGLKILATDSGGASVNSLPFSIKVLPALAASIPTPTKVRLNGTVRIQAKSSNFEAAPTWSLAGTLPGNVTLDAATGIVSGAATTSGSFTGRTLTATQGGGVITTNPFDIIVLDPLVANAPDIYMRTGGSGTSLLAANNVNGSVTWTWSDTPPAWLSLSGSTVTATSGSLAAGTYGPYTVKATDTDFSVNQGVFRVIVVDSFSIGTPTGASYNVGQSVSLAAPSVNGKAGTLTYALLQGGVPLSGGIGSVCPGLSFDTNTGMITGKATSACSPTLTLSVSDDGMGRSNMVASAQSVPFSLSISDGAPALYFTSDASKSSNGFTIDLGTNTNGVSGKTQTISVTNGGTRESSPLMATVTPTAGANAFTISDMGTCGSPVPAGGSCSFNVIGMGASNGVYTASVVVRDESYGVQSTVNLKVAAAYPLTPTFSYPTTSWFVGDTISIAPSSFSGPPGTKFSVQSQSPDYKINSSTGIVYGTAVNPSVSTAVFVTATAPDGKTSTNYFMSSVNTSNTTDFTVESAYFTPGGSSPQNMSYSSFASYTASLVMRSRNDSNGSGYQDSYTVVFAKPVRVDTILFKISAGGKFYAQLYDDIGGRSDEYMNPNGTSQYLGRAKTFRKIVIWKQMDNGYTYNQGTLFGFSFK